MTEKPNAVWEEFISTWQNNQKLATDSMLQGLEQWNSYNQSSNSTTNNPILDIYAQFATTFTKQTSPLFDSFLKNDWDSYFDSLPNGDALSGEIKKALKSGEELFQSFSKDFDSNFKDEESNEFLLKSLIEMSNPSTWLNYAGDSFDLGAHKMSEGTVFSGINDIDKRFAKASDSWIELFEESKKYHSIVFSKWTATYTSFINELNALDKDQRSEFSIRELIVMWTNKANDELLELHRSEEFLNAQRAVIRTSMQYRLAEKNIAEVISEVFHIPTRDEVDDLHKTVTELRRELRQLKAELSANNTKPQKPQPIQLPSTLFTGTNVSKKESNP